MSNQRQLSALLVVMILLVGIIPTSLQFAAAAIGKNDEPNNGIPNNGDPNHDKDSK
jgi:hypothetical protein